MSVLLVEIVMCPSYRNVLRFNPPSNIHHKTHPKYMNIALDVSISWGEGGTLSQVENLSISVDRAQVSFILKSIYVVTHNF